MRNRFARWFFVLTAGFCPLASAESNATLLVVVGAPGEEAFGKDFAKAAKDWVKVARRGEASLVRIGPGDGSDSKTTDRDRLKSAVATELEKDNGRPLWIVFIGHGTFDGKSAKFNLRGRDVSSNDLKAWLAKAKRPLVVLNTSSASSPFINALSAPGRVIVTATKSGFEYNYSRFAGFLSKAMLDPSSDLDKDEQVSILEAFLLAASRTAEFYETEGRLATEHALIDDNGDQRGTPAEFFRGVRAVRSAKGAVPDGSKARHQGLSP
ncbi:MAG: hypothetical protein AAF517_15120, partial [Planctomycetota bacterium]